VLFDVFQNLLVNIWATLEVHHFALLAEHGTDKLLDWFSDFYELLLRPRLLARLFFAFRHI